MFYDIFLVETKLRVKNSPSFFNFKNFFVEKISGFYIDFVDFFSGERNNSSPHPETPGLAV